jgi:PIN domain nuclease of toxin-antitoxin system
LRISLPPFSAPASALADFAEPTSAGAHQKCGLRFLAVTADHAAAIDGLAPTHQDPFEHPLVAQALVVRLRFLKHNCMAASFSDMVILI